jgi:hypothetical protein
MSCALLDLVIYLKYGCRTYYKSYGWIRMRLKLLGRILIDRITTIILQHCRDTTRFIREDMRAYLKRRLSLVLGMEIVSMIRDAKKEGELDV